MLIQSEKYPHVDVAAVASRLTPEDSKYEWKKTPTETQEG